MLFFFISLIIVYIASEIETTNPINATNGNPLIVGSIFNCASVQEPMNNTDEKTHNMMSLTISLTLFTKSS